MILYHRKSRNGFTTTTAVPGVNTSSSHASGLLGTHSTNSIETKSQSLQRNSPGCSQDTQHSLVLCKGRQQLSGVAWMMMSKQTMFKQPRTAQWKRRPAMYKQGKQSHHISLTASFILLYRMAASMRKRIIQDFQSQLYRTCGICSLVLTAYESEDHDLKIAMYAFLNTYTDMRYTTEAST